MFRNINPRAKAGYAQTFQPYDPNPIFDAYDNKRAEMQHLKGLQEEQQQIIQEADNYKLPDENEFIIGDVFHLQFFLDKNDEIHKYAQDVYEKTVLYNEKPFDQRTDEERREIEQGQLELQKRINHLKSQAETSKEVAGRVSKQFDDFSLNKNAWSAQTRYNFQKFFNIDNPIDQAKFMQERNWDLLIEGLDVAKHTRDVRALVESTGRTLEQQGVDLDTYDDYILTHRMTGKRYDLSQMQNMVTNIIENDRAYLNDFKVRGQFKEDILDFTGRDNIYEVSESEVLQYIKSDLEENPQGKVWNYMNDMYFARDYTTSSTSVTRDRRIGRDPNELVVPPESSGQSLNRAVGGNSITSIDWRNLFDSENNLFTKTMEKIVIEDVVSASGFQNKGTTVPMGNAWVYEIKTGFQKEMTSDLILLNEGTFETSFVSSDGKKLISEEQRDRGVGGKDYIVDITTTAIYGDKSIVRAREKGQPQTGRAIPPESYVGIHSLGDSRAIINNPEVYQSQIVNLQNAMEKHYSNTIVKYNERSGNLYDLIKTATQNFGLDYFEIDRIHKKLLSEVEFLN